MSSSKQQINEIVPKLVVVNNQILASNDGKDKLEVREEHNTCNDKSKSRLLFQKS
jgi:hypothetical protein